MEDKAMETRIAVLEENYRNLMRALDKTEASVLGRIDELKSAILSRIESLERDRIESLEHEVKGNGKPGLLRRVTELETNSRVLAARGESADRFWVRLTPFIPYIFGILLAAGMYFVGRGGKP